MYNWISKSTWFGGSWFRETKPKTTTTTTTTTTTPEPVTMATSWFQNLLNSEESDDGAYVLSDASESHLHFTIKILSNLVYVIITVPHLKVKTLSFELSYFHSRRWRVHL